MQVRQDRDHLLQWVTGPVVLVVILPLLGPLPLHVVVAAGVVEWEEL